MTDPISFAARLVARKLREDSRDLVRELKAEGRLIPACLKWCERQMAKEGKDHAG